MRLRVLLPEETETEPSEEGRQYRCQRDQSASQSHGVSCPDAEFFMGGAEGGMGEGNRGDWNPRPAGEGASRTGGGI
ncbi:hypothetical protein GCM10018777_40770 [Streptomyces albogriseolus]|nr:hypothetical protein GCM10018777_40770 [Streptomyces viridodiastaticus]